MAHRLCVIALVSTFAFIAPILPVNASVAYGERSPAKIERQNTVLIARHFVCTKAVKGVCVSWTRGIHTPKPGDSPVRG